YAITSENQIELYVNGEKRDSASAQPLVDLLSENLSLKGSHQIKNGLLALMAVAECGQVARAFELEVAGAEIERRVGPPSPQEYVDTIQRLDVETLRAGLRDVRWPGRLQHLPIEDLLLDGAHNPAGAQALRFSLDQLHPGKKPLFVISS